MSFRKPIAATLLILAALLFAVTPEAAATPDCPGDLTGDGVVNLDDLAQLGLQLQCSGLSSTDGGGMG